MGKQRILAVIAALQSAGFRAERGYPGKGMPYPDAPVVAVSLQEQTRERFTLAVRIYSAVPQGGIFCEDRAMDMVPVLENYTVDRLEYPKTCEAYALRTGFCPSIPDCEP